MSYEWVGPAIAAAASLAGGYFSQKGSKKAQSDELKFRKEELLQQLELEKFRILNQKGGGGGGRSRDLDLLEMALGIYDTESKLKSGAYQSGGDRYAQIYASTMGK